MIAQARHKKTFKMKKYSTRCGQTTSISSSSAVVDFVQRNETRAVGRCGCRLGDDHLMSPFSQAYTSTTCGGGIRRRPEPQGAIMATRSVGPLGRTWRTTAARHKPRRLPSPYDNPGVMLENNDQRVGIVSGIRVAPTLRPCWQ